MTARAADDVFSAMCFGKLPAFGDFVRHNVGGRDAIAFDRWLQQGLYHARVRLGDEWDASFRGSPSYHFLFFPENSESFLLGRLQPSHDRSERRFPFIVSLRVDRRLPAELLPLAPVLFASFLDGATRLMADADGMSAHDIAEATERLDTPVTQDYHALLRAYRLHLDGTSSGELWSRLWDDAGDERAAAVFANLLDVLLPLRGRNPERLALGLRFPAAPERPQLEYTVSFWLEATFRIVGARAPRPFLFWTAPAGRAGDGEPTVATASHLFTFLRQPTARSVLHLLRPDLDGDCIHEMDADGPGRAARRGDALPAWLAAALAARETSLGELLQLLGAQGVELPALRGVPC